jgi:hypothetical protein
MREYERTVDEPELHLQGRLEGFAPVQGWGTVRGFSFYFRARHDEWSFAISEHPAVDPVDIQLPEQGKKYGFLREGNLSGKPREYLASHLELAEAEKIIKQCVTEYLQLRDAG